MNAVTASEFLKRNCIAITGSVATGKSTVAQMLRDLGFVVFDADQFARLIVTAGSKTLADIAARFGDGVLDQNKALKREALRQLVLSDDAARMDLENITHPAIHDELLLQAKRLMARDPKSLFFYEASLIHEKNRGHLFRETWCTYCPYDMQLLRLTSRTQPKITSLDAAALIRSQLSAGEKAQRSTRVIDTSVSLENVQQQISNLLKLL